MAVKNIYDSYKDTEILTADQGKLIVMLYDGAVRFLNVALENIHDFRKYDVVNNHIIKAQDIVTELMLSLNLEEGGEIARNLFNIYAYLKKRLLEANIKKDASILKEVINHLNTLKSAWEQAAKNYSKTTVREEKVSAGFSISG